MGFGNANLGPTCIVIYSDGTPIGMGGTNAVGKFTIAVSPALACRECIHAEDVCTPGGLVGLGFVVTCNRPAPTLSRPSLAFLAAALTVGGILIMRRRSARRSPTGF